MKARSRLLAAASVVGLSLFLAGCPNDNPYLAQDDAGMEPDAGPDTATFTTFVIDLINNHGSDLAPATYESFKDLPDPDGDTNNTTAFSGLFQ